MSSLRPAFTGNGRRGPPSFKICYQTYISPRREAVVGFSFCKYKWFLFCKELLPQEISAIVKKSCFLLKKSPPGAPYSGVPKSGKQPLAHLPRNALWHSVLQLAVFRLAKSGKTQRKRRQTAWPFVSSCGSSAILLDENRPVEGVPKLGISPLQGFYFTKLWFAIRLATPY